MSTTEIFTTEEFEQALPKQFIHAGIEFGEHIWLYRVNDSAQILIRSSINEKTNKADGTGENSIRTYIEIYRKDNTVQRLKRKYHYVTRLPGWGERLVDQLRKDWLLAANIEKRVPNCDKCDKHKVAWIIKSGKNEGKVGCKCFECDSGFEVL